jgi:hypothetical protein
MDYEVAVEQRASEPATPFAVQSSARVRFVSKEIMVGFNQIVLSLGEFM